MRPLANLALSVLFPPNKVPHLLHIFRQNKHNITELMNVIGYVLWYSI